MFIFLFSNSVFTVDGCAKIMKGCHIGIVFPVFLRGNALWTIWFSRFDSLDPIRLFPSVAFRLLNFPLVEPAFAEGDAETELEVVLGQSTLPHGVCVQIGDVGMYPLNRHVDERTVVPDVAVGDREGDTSGNTDLIGLVSHYACNVCFGIRLRVISTDLVGAPFKIAAGGIGVRNPIHS